MLKTPDRTPALRAEAFGVIAACCFLMLALQLQGSIMVLAHFSHVINASQPVSHDLLLQVLHLHVLHKGCVTARDRRAVSQDGSSVEGRLRSLRWPKEASLGGVLTSHAMNLRFSKAGCSA